MGNWVTVLHEGEIPAGAVKVVEAGGHRVVLCHVAEGYFAIEDVCTHDNGPLGEGELFGEALECPRHGARFDVRTGKPLTLPAVIPVASYLVRVNGSEIQIELPEGGKAGA